jgi:hypothetical protein
MRMLDSRGYSQQMKVETAQLLGKPESVRRKEEGGWRQRYELTRPFICALTAFTSRVGHDGAFPSRRNRLPALAENDPN